MKAKSYQQEVNTTTLSSEILLLGLSMDLTSILKTVDNNQTPHSCLTFSGDLDGSEWVSVDATVAAHVAVGLAEVKADKNAQIDTKTRELIAEGFVYDGDTFSLSDAAQRNWIAIATSINFNLMAQILGADPRPDNFPVLFGAWDAVLGVVFPLSVTTIDDGAYTFQTIGEYAPFFSTGFSTANSHYTTGRDLKVLVKDATTVTAVNAITDNR